MFCPACGNQSPSDNAQFCIKCGARFPAAEAAAPAPVQTSAPPPAPRVVLDDNPPPTPVADDDYPPPNYRLWGAVVAGAAVLIGGGLFLNNYLEQRALMNLPAAFPVEHGVDVPLATAYSTYQFKGSTGKGMDWNSPSREIQGGDAMGAGAPAMRDGPQPSAPVAAAKPVATPEPIDPAAAAVLAACASVPLIPDEEGQRDTVARELMTIPKADLQRLTKGPQAEQMIQGGRKWTICLMRNRLAQMAGGKLPSDATAQANAKPSAPATPPHPVVPVKPDYIYRNHVDANFNPDWSAFNAAADAKTAKAAMPFMKVSHPTRGNMYLHISMLLCEASEHPEIYPTCVSKSSPVASTWINVEFDGKKENPDCKPVSECDAMWREKGAAVIAAARALQGN